MAYQLAVDGGGQREGEHGRQEPCWVLSCSREGDEFCAFAPVRQTAARKPAGGRNGLVARTIHLATKTRISAPDAVKVHIICTWTYIVPRIAQKQCSSVAVLL